MNHNDIERMIDSEYDDSREDTLRGMISTFYSKQMWSTALMVWVWGLVFFAGVIASAILFGLDNSTRGQVMYAAVFVSCWIGVGLMKIFAWQMLHRHSIKREIKRLELRVAELAEAVKREG